MKNLKNRILNGLKQNRVSEDILKDLAKVRDNLLKNYSNPALKDKDRGKLLKSYTDLQDIEKSLYRYNTLQEHNYMNEAQEEKEDLQHRVLKGGISYYQYVWHAENSEKTCETCRELDGQVFDFSDEVPERPHPNCKCTVDVEEVENENDEPQKDKKTPPTPPQPKTSQEQKWIMPCKGPIVGQYGEPRSNHTHDGIDIAVPIGTPIVAVASGTVVEARPASGYGKFVVIEHIVNGQTVTSEYGHISRWIVNRNQVVKQGQVIAYSGNEGYSQGPHLHLTIRIGKYRGKAVDPRNYLNY